MNNYNISEVKNYRPESAVMDELQKQQHREEDQLKARVAELESEVSEFMDYCKNDDVRIR